MEYSNLIPSKIGNIAGQKAAWDSYWDKKFLQKVLNIGRRTEISLYLSTILEPYLKVNSFCEIGSGTGLILSEVAKTAKEVVAIDYSKKSLETIEKNFKELGVTNYRIFERDIRNLTEFNEKFDVVFSNGLVEHFQEPYKAIEAHLHLTQPGGVVVILVPYFYSFKNTWFNLTDNKLLKRFWPWTEQYFFTPRSLMDEFKKIELEDEVFAQVHLIRKTENVALVLEKK